MGFENGSQQPGAKRNPDGLRWAYLLGGLPYPLWHLATPAGANDPWIFWWLIAAGPNLVANTLIAVLAGSLARSLRRSAPRGSQRRRYASTRSSGDGWSHDPAHR